MSTKKSSSYLSVNDLAEALDLQSEGHLFVNLLTRIRQISQQIFNPHETYDHQENEKIAEFSARMSQEFPDVLQDPTRSSEVQRRRTKAVMLYCGQCFNSYRNTLRKRERRAPTPSLSTPPSTKGVKKGKKAQRPPHRMSTPSPTVLNSPKSSRKPRTPQTPSPINSRPTTRTSRSGTVDRRVSPRTPSPLASTSSQHSYSAWLARYQTRKPEACISDVAEFLGTCEPDMRYLLPSFMDFGCRNVEFLINISCQEEKDIEMLLRKIVNLYPPVEGVEEMDILVITKHFKQYFFGRSEKSN